MEEMIFRTENDWTMNMEIYRNWEYKYGKSLPELKIDLCISQYGELQLDRKLLWVHTKPGEDFPIVIIPNTSEKRLSETIIPWILNKYGNERRKVKRVVMDEIGDCETLWSSIRDGQYVSFDVEYE